MPRVQNIGTTSTGRTPVSGETAAAPEVGFRQQLLTARLGTVNQEIDRHLAELERLGQRLAVGGSIEDVHRYREAVANFFRDVTAQAYRVHKELDWDSQTWEQRAMVALQKVNKHLDELAEMVHTREQDRLKILDKTGLITGLLLDLRV